MTTDTTQHAWWWRLKEALLWQSGRHPLRILTALSLGGLSLGVLSGVVGTLLLTTSILTPDSELRTPYWYIKTNLQTHYGVSFILTCESPELRAVNDWPETHINGVWVLCWETER
jgi:hypothetical protein